MCVACLHKRHSECDSKRSLGPCSCACVNIEGLSYVELVDKLIEKKRRRGNQEMEETIL